MRAAFLSSLIFVASGLAQNAEAIFDTAHLHDVYIVMDAGDWQTLRDDYLSSTKYPAAFYWNEFQIQNVSVRSRGTTSRDPEKPGLKVDFDAVDKQQRFGVLKSIVLDNNTQDKSLIKERLSMDLFTRVGAHAPRVSLGKLFVNGTYVGVYTVTEPVDEMFLDRVFGESEGYLYEYNAIEPYFFEDLGDDPAKYIPERFEPKTHEKNPNPAPLIDFVQKINSLPASEFADYLRSVTDVPRLLRYLAAEQYLADVDGLTGWAGINNFYLYQAGSPAKFEFIAWDKDLTFAYQGSVFERFDQIALTRRIYEDPQLRSEYLGYVEEIANAYGGEGGWLEREFDFSVQQVREAARSDPKLLCSAFDGEPVPCTGDDGPFEEEVRRMRDIIQHRTAHVLQEVNTFREQSTQ